MEAIRDMVKCVPINPVARPELNPELDSIRHHLSAIIAFVNPKSGGQKGRVVLESLKNYLPKENIFDLSKGGPRAGLEEHKDKTNLKIVACGGDGTAGWVLSVLDEMDFDASNKPAISIIPLGTGNDLARTFAWGGGYDNERMEEVLNKVINGCVVPFDRWRIRTINPCDSPIDQSTVKLAFPPMSFLTRESANIWTSVRNAKTKVVRQVSDSSAKIAKKDVHKTFSGMSDSSPAASANSTRSYTKLPLSSVNNYFSIGADSKIALEFHKAREEHPEQFNSQISNKLEYAKIYGEELFHNTCRNITKSIKVLECDGVDYLPKLQKMNCECLLVLNIPYYMGGTKPWKNGTKGFSNQSYSDGKLEIVGFRTADFMFLQVGRHGQSIAQGSEIRIETSASLPMEVDGEPVNLNPSEIFIEHRNQVNMIHADPFSPEVRNLVMIDEL